MAENEPTNDPAPEPTNDPTPDPPADPPEPAKDPTDWVAEARKWEKRAKENSDAAARLQELEDAQKSEQDKLTERLTAAEKRAADNELRAMRLEVAAEKGLTKAQAKYLTGTTEDELTEAADELLELFAPAEEDGGPSRRPQERLRPGATPSTEPEKSPEELADAVLKRQRGY